MDYYAIGQRIRKKRKAHNLSQEELAECVGISVTHMSHIETGNTKLSLSVLAEISSVLEVRADDLLFDNVIGERNSSVNSILQLLEGCTTEQIRIIEDVIKALKVSLEKHSS